MQGEATFVIFVIYSNVFIYLSDPYGFKQLFESQSKIVPRTEMKADVHTPQLRICALHVMDLSQYRTDWHSDILFLFPQ